MTRDEFFTELDRIKGLFHWFLDKRGRIRAYRGTSSKRKTGFCYCPVTAVAKELTGKSFHTSQWLKAADVIKLEWYRGSITIVYAADKMNCHNLDLRQELFMRVGLAKRK